MNKPLRKYTVSYVLKDSEGYITEVFESYIKGDLFKTVLYKNSNNFIDEIFSYKNDIQEGPYLIFWENGNLREFSEYHNNKLHGNSILYYDDGTLNYSQVYENGVQISSSDGLTTEQRIKNFYKKNIEK